MLNKFKNYRLIHNSPLMKGPLAWRSWLNVDYTISYSSYGILASDEFFNIVRYNFFFLSSRYFMESYLFLFPKWGYRNKYMFTNLFKKEPLGISWNNSAVVINHDTYNLIESTFCNFFYKYSFYIIVEIYKISLLLTLLKVLK